MLRCDGCGAYHESLYSELRLARREARRSGWKHKGNDDRCPKCAAAALAAKAGAK